MAIFILGAHFAVRLVMRLWYKDGRKTHNARYLVLKTVPGCRVSRHVVMQNSDAGHTTVHYRVTIYT